MMTPLAWVGSGLVLVAVLAAICIEFYQQRLGVPPMFSFGRARMAMLESVPQHQTGEIIELGAGWGGLAFALARRCPAATVVAYELSLLPWMVLNLRKIVQPRRNLELKRENFFSVSFKNADIIVCYLTNALMAQLEPKFKEELQSTKVISNTFYLPTIKPAQVIDIKRLYDTKIYIYAF